jgi:pimeloyl-ACP methyl ester carboxylesterase
MTPDSFLPALPVQRHGQGPTQVICLHGGPGAGASLACVAEPLADQFTTLDYIQRRSGDVPLTVAQHVEDLQNIIDTHCSNQPPVVLGASWGAMLALAFAAAHPQQIAGLVLVGCGTFDTHSRAMIGPTRDSRIRPEHHAEIARLEREIPDPIERIGAMHELTGYVDNYDPIPLPPSDYAPPPLGFDAPGFDQSWNDMIRLQNDGTYPAAFAAITAPVLMLHGSYDPHPGKQIRDSLLPHIPHLEYVELPQCGHDPWCERHARQPFFQTLTDWLAQVLAQDRT